MGVDISFIIPNKMRSKRIHKDNVRCLDETIAQVKKYFRGRERFVTSRIVEREDSDSKYVPKDDFDTIYSFCVPYFDAEFELHCGYWDIETYYHYCRYFLYTIDNTGQKCVILRNVFFDIARILGYDEGWVCDEYHSWNCGLEENDGFEEWLKYPKDGDKDESMVHEYDISIAKSYNEIQKLDYKSKYHDTFKECRELFNHYQEVFPAYEIVTISQAGDYILAAQGDDLYLLNVNTGDRLTDFPIDGCDNTLNCGDFVVYKGKESALFTKEGKQVTPFREGTFTWDWHHKRFQPCDDIVITDEATGHKYLSDGSRIYTNMISCIKHNITKKSNK